MASFSLKADTLGAAASLLCMIHCLATPFLFVAQACSSVCCSGAPTWWRAVDFVFLAVAALAIFRSMKTSSKRWVWQLLWITWVVLAWTITMEAFRPSAFFPWVKYVAASALICLHFYNLKYCHCGSPQCTAHCG
ncbi:MAG TPA: MerC domain-containing protein [Deltaproteobacteria bacterium]|nr:hypothetical protein [Crocinitomicaceae bacterium]HCV87134.1 MerC domain-containing protein [Deltaproteobacteria bacterium]